MFAASRGVLEMIEILKVKREFLYLLLTLTQEKNVKVSRFPLIHLDETILAHTNLAEFRKFLQEAENEALLDRMVIIQVPYTLSYKEEARIYRKLVSSTQAFREVHLDPHALHVAAVFAVLTRLAEGEEREADNTKKVRLYAGEDVEGVSQSQSEVEKMRAKNPDEGLAGVSPRFVINALSNAIIQSQAKSLTTMNVLIALKDAIDSDVRIDGKKKRKWIDFLVTVRKDFYNRWVKEDVHKALFVSFEDEAQQLLDKYLDEVEATLDNRTIKDPITNEERKPDERFLRSVEEKIQHLRVRQALVPPGGGAQGDGRLQARREVHPRQPRAAARRGRAVPVRAAPRRAAPGHARRRAPTRRRGRRSRWSRSAWSTSTATTRTAPARRSTT